MKFLTYSFSIVLLFLVAFSCSDDDEVSVITSIPVGINIVKANGSDIGANECISPDLSYGVVVRVRKEGSGTVVPTEVRFNINGATYTTTFEEESTKIIPVDLVIGLNVAQINSTNIQDELTIREQDICETKVSTIRFVNVDGTTIDLDNCVSPSLMFGIKITIDREGNEEPQPFNAIYTLNGETRVESFGASDSEKIIPVDLVVGSNVVQIQDSELSSSLEITESNVCTINVLEVEFVNTDGTPIDLNLCVLETLQYAVFLSIEREGNDPPTAFEVFYTVNGIERSTTFSASDNEKTIITNLQFGLNTLTIQDTSISQEILITEPQLGDFEEVF